MVAQANFPKHMMASFEAAKRGKITSGEVETMASKLVKDIAESADGVAVISQAAKSLAEFLAPYASDEGERAALKTFANGALWKFKDLARLVASMAEQLGRNSEPLFMAAASLVADDNKVTVGESRDLHKLANKMVAEAEDPGTVAMGIKKIIGQLVEVLQPPAKTAQDVMERTVRAMDKAMGADPMRPGELSPYGEFAQEIQLCLQSMGGRMLGNRDQMHVVAAVEKEFQALARAMTPAQNAVQVQMGEASAADPEQLAAKQAELGQAMIDFVARQSGFGESAGLEQSAKDKVIDTLYKVALGKMCAPGGEAAMRAELQQVDREQLAEALQNPERVKDMGMGDGYIYTSVNYAKAQTEMLALVAEIVNGGGDGDRYAAQIDAVMARVEARLQRLDTVDDDRITEAEIRPFQAAMEQATANMGANEPAQGGGDEVAQARALITEDQRIDMIIGQGMQKIADSGSDADSVTVAQLMQGARQALVEMIQWLTHPAGGIDGFIGNIYAKSYLPDALFEAVSRGS